MRLRCLWQGGTTLLKAYHRPILTLGSIWIITYVLVSFSTRRFIKYVTAKSKRNDICEQCNHLNPADISTTSRYRFQFADNEAKLPFSDCKYCLFIWDAIASFVGPVSSPEPGEIWSGWFRSNRQAGLLTLEAVEETRREKRVRMQLFSAQGNEFSRLYPLSTRAVSASYELTYPLVVLPQTYPLFRDCPSDLTRSANTTPPRRVWLSPALSLTCARSIMSSAQRKILTFVQLGLSTSSTMTGFDSSKLKIYPRVSNTQH